MCKVHSIPSHGSYCDFVSRCNYPFLQDEQCNLPYRHRGEHRHVSPVIEEGWNFESPLDEAIRVDEEKEARRYGYYDAFDIPRQEMNKRRIKLHECDDDDHGLQMRDLNDARIFGLLTFTMYRDADSSGVSGTGKVLEGAVFSDGTVVARWLTLDAPRSTVVYANFTDFANIHVNPHPFNSTTIEFSNGLHWKQEADPVASTRKLFMDHFGHKWEGGKPGCSICDAPPTGGMLL